MGLPGDPLLEGGIRGGLDAGGVCPTGTVISGCAASNLLSKSEKSRLCRPGIEPTTLCFLSSSALRGWAAVNPVSAPLPPAVEACHQWGTQQSAGRNLWNHQNILQQEAAAVNQLSETCL